MPVRSGVEYDQERSTGLGATTIRVLKVDGQAFTMWPPGKPVKYSRARHGDIHATGADLDAAIAAARILYAQCHG